MDVTSARERRDEDERKWDDLVSQCRTSAWLGVAWLGLFLFFALMGGFMLSRFDEVRAIYFAPVAFLAITSPMIFVGQRRREGALLAMISRDAPHLFQKLKDAGIG